MTAIINRLRTHKITANCFHCAGRGRVIGFMGTDFGSCSRCAGRGKIKL